MHATHSISSSLSTLYARKSTTVLSLHRMVCMFITFSLYSLFIKLTILIFLYIANLACNSADDVDGRHWMVGLVEMSIYIHRVTTSRPPSFFLSLSSQLFRSVYFFFFFFFCIFSSSVYSRCMLCAWFSLRAKQDREKERCAFVYYRLKKGETYNDLSTFIYIYKYIHSSIQEIFLFNWKEMSTIVAHQVNCFVLSLKQFYFK